MSRSGIGLESIQAFKGVHPTALLEITQKLSRRLISRGEFLVRQGDSSTALFIVLSGRFHVEIAGTNGAVAEIGAGNPIGEIAFFTGEPRTASVRATRDSVVLELGREEFDRISSRDPTLWSNVTASLARRLVHANATLRPRTRSSPSTIALCPISDSQLPLQFVRRLQTTLSETANNAVVLDRHAVPADISKGTAHSSEAATNWFNEIESQYRLVIFVCDPGLTHWTEKAIRQADEVVLIAMHSRKRSNWNLPLSPTEKFARSVHDTDAHRLVLLHSTRSSIKGTTNWLQSRPVRMHHHIALRHAPDYARLCRFITGSAVGLVAGGGGALSASHIGVYKALLESNIPIDMMGGTSGGGAMTAAFAMGATPEQVDVALEDIFVRKRALKRMTWPRYSLLDHAQFDESLAFHYTDTEIADLWIPYFALSTNLSRNAPYIHRSGKLWETVRATGSIPGLLPPCYTDEGDMLVDGGILDNVPVSTMHDLKWGPNIVVNLSVERGRKYNVNYSQIPSRNQLFSLPLRWLLRKSLPEAPGPATVLMQSMVAHRPHFKTSMTERDLLLSPPIPSNASMMDWSIHSALMRSGFEYAMHELARARVGGHSFFSPASK